MEKIYNSSPQKTRTRSEAVGNVANSPPKRSKQNPTTGSPVKGKGNVTKAKSFESASLLSSQQEQTIGTKVDSTILNPHMKNPAAAVRADKPLSRSLAKTSLEKSPRKGLAKTSPEKSLRKGLAKTSPEKIPSKGLAKPSPEKSTRRAAVPLSTRSSYAPKPTQRVAAQKAPKSVAISQVKNTSSRTKADDKFGVKKTKSSASKFPTNVSPQKALLKEKPKELLTEPPNQPLMTDDGIDDEEDYSEDYESDFESDVDYQEDDSESTDDSDDLETEESTDFEVARLLAEEISRRTSRGVKDSENYQEYLPQPSTVHSIKSQRTIEDPVEDQNQLVEDQDLLPTAIKIASMKTVHRVGNENKIVKATSARQRNFNNLQVALDREKTKKLVEKNKKRADDLLSMIDLDQIDIPILDVAPISYDEYIRIYGNSGTNQASCQYNEDFMDEECLCEPIEYMEKWSQFPPAVQFNLLDGDQDDIGLFVSMQQSMQGVSGNQGDTYNTHVKINTEKFLAFFRSASQLALNVLYENELIDGCPLQFQPSPTQFSNGVYTINYDKVAILNGRSVTHVQFSSFDNNIFVTVHVAIEQPQSVCDNCIACVWDIGKEEFPKHVLVSYSDITCCALNYGKAANLLFAGLQDGSVAMWDLGDKLKYQQTILTELNCTVTSPTILTVDKIDGYHHSTSVIGIAALCQKDHFHSVKVVSVDETGEVTIGQIFDRKTLQEPETASLGAACWSSYKLGNVSSFSVHEKNNNRKSSCSVLKVNQLTEHLYFGMLNGLVMHFDIDGNPAKPELFVRDNDFCIAVTALEANYSAPTVAQFLMVAYTDGVVHIYSVHSGTALYTFSGTTFPITSLMWSHGRPGVFMVLDARYNFSVWDLCVHDLFSIYSVNLHELIQNASSHSDYFPTNAAYSCEPYPGKSEPYLVIIHNNGRIEINIMTKDLLGSGEQQRTVEAEHVRKLLLAHSSLKQ